MRLVYISTFNKEPGSFDYECEIQNAKAALGYETVRSGVDVSFSVLESVLMSHLGENNIPNK